MGSTRTWLVAAAVGVLGAAAVVDAIVGGDAGRGDARAPSPPPAESALVASGADFLRDESVFGRLLVADRSCRVRTLDLPSLEEGTPGGVASCAFSSSPRGVVGPDAGAVSPLEPYLAGCAGGAVEIVRVTGAGGLLPELGRRVARVRGCSPAWSEDGRLTVVREGEAVDLGRPDIPGRDVVILSRDDLADAFGRPWDFVHPRLVEVAWMDEGLLAGVVRDGGGQGDVLALFRGGRLAATTLSPYERLSGIRVSPRGTYVAARIADAPALVLLDREGEFVPLGVRGHAVTWSPDEVFTAVAADDGIYVFETEGRATRFARIPLAVGDLFWL